MQRRALQALQQRQHIGGGFARSGLGESDEILALEGERDRGGLDVRGFLVSQLFDGGEKRLGQAEGGEGGMVHSGRQVE